MNLRLSYPINRLLREAIPTTFGAKENP